MLVNVSKKHDFFGKSALFNGMIHCPEKSDKKPGLKFFEKVTSKFPLLFSLKMGGDVRHAHWKAGTELKREKNNLWKKQNSVILYLGWPDSFFTLDFSANTLQNKH